ncbi:MAG TPA: phosphopantetheine-binding protein [Candidatus Kapabacteria bacterium]|nr:phosphopantetheine-binding protein [Candidatus Kapabacteria bacterium]
MRTSEEVFSIVKEELRDALRVKPEKITPQARIFSELGAESIDILDLRFRLEKQFQLQITDGEILERLGNDLSVEQFDALFTVQSVVDFVMERLAKETSKVA